MKLILSFLLILQIIILFIFFFDLSSLRKSEVVNLSNVSSDVVFSLTTIPDRIEFTKHTILSLLNGSVLPEKIIFNIPYKSLKGKEYIIPEWLTDLTARYPLLVLNRCQDYGPATKIIPTLIMYQTNLDQKIIYIDDDVIYHKHFLRNFINDYQKTRCEDRDEVLARKGYRVNFFKMMCRNKPIKEVFKKRFILPFVLLILTTIFFYFFYRLKGVLIFWNISLLLLNLFMVYTYKASYNDVAMGVNGVLVKPKYFNLQKLLDYEKYPKEVVFHDDIYLSGHLRENGIKILIVGDKLNFTHYTDTVNSLCTNINLDENNRCVSLNCFNW